MPSCFRLILLLAIGCVSVCWTQTGSQEREVREYWDKVYSAEKPIFSKQPTELLVKAIKGRRPGKALDIGMGQGRNSIFLARSGWDVTGFDPSREGIRQAQAQAQKLGISLRALVATEEEFDLGSAQWDVIVMTYVRRLRAGDEERLAGALKPQGIFVYENNNVGEQNELLRHVLPFRIVLFEDIYTTSDWHPHANQRVERLIAEKAQQR